MKEIGKSRKVRPLNGVLVVRSVQLFVSLSGVADISGGEDLVREEAGVTSINYHNWTVRSPGVVHMKRVAYYLVPSVYLVFSVSYFVFYYSL